MLTEHSQLFLKSIFDPQWYLEAYPDVAAAGVDPYLHFVAYGHAEGRYPCELPALILEQQLWQENDLPRVQLALETLLQQAGLHQALAAWVLARWHASYGRWTQVHNLMPAFFACREARYLIAHQGPCLLFFSASVALDDSEGIAQILADKQWPDKPDKLLARSMLETEQEKLALLSRLWAGEWQSHLQKVVTALPLSLDNLQIVASDKPHAIYRGLFQPLVSVIMPLYNASVTLDTALRSLTQQSWQKLEIIVVDDASTDDSVVKIRQWIIRDPRIKLIVLAHNQGAYAARNTALQQAKGQYITTHDADDWSHSQKIELQVNALRNNSRWLASVSHWVRCSPELHFGRWRVEDAWIYRNVSSLMFKRKVLRRIGYWDLVSVNADTEYYYRIKRVFGEQAVGEVLPGIPLSFGRADPASLSQTKATHLRTQFRGVRKDYHDAALTWHHGVSTSRLYLAAFPDRRAFAVPEIICRGNQSQKLDNRRWLTEKSGVFDKKWRLSRYPDVAAVSVAPLTHYLSYGEAEGRDPTQKTTTICRDIPVTDPVQYDEDTRLLQGSALFDAEYYLAQNPDIKAAGVNPVVHYLHHGAAEGREPSLLFSGAAYQALYPDVVLSGLNPLVHFLRYGELAGRQLQQNFTGWQAPVNGPVVLLAGHAAGATLFGAERSLLDVLKALNVLGYRVIVTLPEAQNTEYLAQLRPFCQEVVVFPYRWWQASRQMQPEVVQSFKQLMQRHQVQLLHANTLVHYEALLAARELGVKVAVHVRELPALDPALCDALHATPEQILNQVQQQADLVIANSAFTASQYPGCRQLAVVRNTLSVAEFYLPSLQPSKILRLALISSNSAKKGLSDFVQLAGWLSEQQLPVQCLLIGPDNAEKQALLLQQQQGELPHCLTLADYCADPLDALRQADVVLNLSHFQESFGRSILEAMAAGRLVVAYRWGALPELIQHGETGFLLPFGDINGVGQVIAQLIANPQRLQQVAAAGQQFASQEFSLQTFSRQLANAYQLLGL